MSKRRKLTKGERMEIYRKTNGHCAYCGCALEYSKMQVDHVVPLRKGGADTKENMLPACRSCNHYKSTLNIEQFRDSIEKFPDVLIKDSVTYKNAVRYGLVIPNPQQIIFYFERKLNNG